ncbi:MAG: hypothetical protein LBR39_04790 [Coriobacteriales bacterium]|nr:hypothetical protein [Coriobacteriales bacterium]
MSSRDRQTMDNRRNTPATLAAHPEPEEPDNPEKSRSTIGIPPAAAPDASIAPAPAAHPEPEQPEKTPHDGQGRRPDVLKRALATVFVILTLFSVLFSFDLLPLERAEPREGWLDAEGNSITGRYMASKDEYVGAVTISFMDGASYEGELKGNRFSGQGTFTAVDGWTLSGEFVNGRLNGQGSYQGADGSYSGQFKDSLPDGYGAFSSVDGWSYAGDFLAGRIHGQGTLTFADGSTYSGSFKDGLADGYGEVTNPVWSYSGDFTAGYRNGTGTLVFDNGEEITGTWQAGLYIED